MWVYAESDISVQACLEIPGQSMNNPGMGYLERQSGGPSVVAIGERQTYVIKSVRVHIQGMLHTIRVQRRVFSGVLKVPALLWLC